jgi:hypothetical protein
VQFATDVTFVTSLSSGYSPQTPYIFYGIAGQLTYTMPTKFGNNSWILMDGVKLDMTKYLAQAGQYDLILIDMVLDGGEKFEVINW